jgi:hypothetical protein
MWEGRRYDGYIRVFFKVILSFTLSLALFSPPPPYPLFEWGLQSKEVLLILGMKCWNSGHLEATKYGDASWWLVQSTELITSVCYPTGIQQKESASCQKNTHKNTHTHTHHLAWCTGGCWLDLVTILTELHNTWLVHLSNLN